MGAQAVRLSNIDIDKALENKDFEVLFQPIFDLGNGALARMESFVRWRHSDLGVLPPGAFISFFENQGRMSELTRYVLAEALAGYTQWRGPFAPGFSINLAFTDLSDDAFANHFTKLMRDRDFPPDLVTLECPMPPVDVDLARAAAQFERLRKTGARLAIEVRGRANDFLRQIDPFPFDEIKTGGSSILRFARTVRGPGLSAISDLLELANKANAVITAVGVEDQASLAALRGLGFTAAQGNHLAKVGALKEFRPGRVNEVRELLGLSPLSLEDLAAVFRTSAPEPKAARAPAPGAAKDESRPAPAAAADAKVEAPAQNADEAAAAAASDDAERRAKAREKAKALILAKRAKAREARKAAAIKRAKAKAAQAKRNEAASAAAPERPPAAPPAVPRDLQERLALEFSGAPEHSAAMDAPENKGSTPVPDVAAEADKGHAAPRAEEKQIQPASGAAQTVASEASKSLRMAVGAARAYFQPGIRVGGPAFNAHMETSSMRRAEALRAAAAPEPEQPRLALDDDADEPSAPRADSPPAAAEKGHLAEDGEPGKPSAPARRRKNFLTRKYRVRMPDHFWPKSWKRRMRRWKAARGASDRPAEAAE